MKNLLIYFIILVSFCACSTKSKKSLAPDLIYNKALLAMKSKKYLKAGELWEKLEREYPESELMAITRLNQGDVSYELGEYEKAREAYLRFLKLHPLYKEAHRARYRTALCYFKEISPKDKDQTATKLALSEFQRYLQEYPKGELVDKVRENINLCRLRLAEHDLYIAEFYMKKKNYVATRNRLQKILATYPDISFLDNILYLYYESYFNEAMYDESKYFFELLLKNYPDSAYIAKINRMKPRY